MDPSARAREVFRVVLTGSGSRKFAFVSNWARHVFVAMTKFLSVSPRHAALSLICLPFLLAGCSTQ